MPEINGLYPTRARLALLRAVAEGFGRIYLEPGDKQVYDRSLGGKVTARVTEMVRHQWVVASAPGQPRGAGELNTRTYYRLTDMGRTALGIKEDDRG